MNVILQIIGDHPLGFIGVILFLVGLGYLINGNILNAAFGLVFGAFLAFISEFKDKL